MPLIPTRKFAAVLVVILTGAAAAAFMGRAHSQGAAQTQPGSTMNHNLIVLDPAHGGTESGTLLGDHVFEKDVTLEFATKLRATLTAAGFSVISTRDAELLTPLTNDQRAEIANRSHALACLVIHATASGSGVHLYTSALQPPAEQNEWSYSSPAPAFVAMPWDQAQVGFVLQSQHLASDLVAALNSANLPVLNGREPLRPLDNLTCPAVAIELAPLRVSGQDATPVTDADYQQRVVSTLFISLLAWRNHADAAGALPALTSHAPATSRPATPVLKTPTSGQVAGHASTGNSATNGSKAINGTSKPSGGKASPPNSTPSSGVHENKTTQPEGE
ncbi:MAG: N-acetylmuramoyl-L-alanine amidase [Acidobacteriaceae bacterium]|nr:N-acetylmuramoyl-L-alanine amidase [Acidobacteriaceae bacterium]